MAKHNRFKQTVALSAWLGTLCLTSWAAAETPDEAGVDFFEKKIRPVLVAQCYECHSAKSEKLKGGLRLDSRAGMLDGGDTGPALVPGNVDESLLIEAIRYGEDSYQMPPSGKLPDAVIADFEKWVKLGAPDPRTDKNSDEPPTNARASLDIDAGRKFWSFQLPQHHAAPSVQDKAWPRKPLDAFVLAKIEAAGLAPSPRADRQTLIRRASFDLIGIPPTPEETEAFLADESPDALAKLIDRLLDSPHYGERWGRHWLDVVRYAEDNTNMGPFNGPYHHAYRYRDWVIQAINDDVPFDQFVRRQLATDLLPETGPDDIPALGFLGLSPSYHKELKLAKVVLENRFADEWEDRVDAVGRGLLGLTLACARCHDHKYDPVTSRDYYALAGIFASCRQTTRPIIDQSLIDESQPARDQVAKLDKQVQELDKQLQSLTKQHQAAEKKKDSAGSAQLKKQLEATRASATKLKAKIAEIKKSTPHFDLPLADALTEETVRVEQVDPQQMKLAYYPGKPRDLPIFVRGDAGKPGKIVPRGFLEVLSPGEPQDFTQGSGRLELADAIASPDNPLTARVIVNRVWAHHFGTGLVSTPSNFGQLGARPSHPKLLDTLAVWFMDQGWSLKKLHRLIMLSATYQQSSRRDPARVAADPDNRLLSRFSRRRLDVEAYRDTLLAVSGRLDRAMGGPSFDADDAANSRRTVYAKVSRHKLSNLLATFDFPDPAIHCAWRAQTTTPLQQLFIMNSQFMRNSAGALAEQLIARADDSTEARVQLAHQLLFSRAATPAELQIAREFLAPVSPAPAASERDVDTLNPTAADFSGGRLRAKLIGLGGTYSVEFWFQNQLANDARPVTGYFFSRGNNSSKGAPGDHFGIGGTSLARGRLLFYNGDTLRQVLEGTTIVQPGDWNHVVLVRDGTSVAVYLNGGEKPEINGQAKVGHAPDVEQIYLGGRNDNFANFQGKLDEVAIYDRVLAVKEISTHYQASGLPDKPHAHGTYAKAITLSKPRAYWPLGHQANQSAAIVDATAHKTPAVYEENAGPAGPPDPGIALWQRYAQALLASNELMYVD